MSGSRTRNYATVIYDISCIDKINEMHLPCFISPCHDRDINPTGEHKKAHWHVLINYDSVKTEQQAKDDIKSFGGVGCEIVKSNRAYARYLCHLDNPEKAQYSINDVKVIGGLDYVELVNSSADVLALELEIADYLLENNIISFRSFIIWCKDNKRDWYQHIIHRSMYFVKEIIKSNYIEQNKNL